MLDAMIVFATWADVVAHVQAGLRTYYHAPLDVRPRLVACKAMPGDKVRVSVLAGGCDPFTADAGHLDRFRKLA